MPAAGLLKYCYLAWLSQPRGERAIYRAMRRAKVANIVELGVGKGVRAKRLLEVAQRFSPGAGLRYTGIDLFEARPPEAAALTLKQAHRTLGDTGAKVQLVPGDPLAALSRAANGLTKTDLLVISADQDRMALARAWFYVPRMLRDDALVFLEEPGQKGQTVFRRLSLNEVADLAKAADARHARRAA